MNTNLLSTLAYRPIGASAQPLSTPAHCAHTALLNAPRAAVDTLDHALDAPAGSACVNPLCKPQALRPRRSLRAVLAPDVRCFSAAELRDRAEEQVKQRMLRAWMSKLQRKDLQSLVHALPLAERSRFAELASLAIDQAVPRTAGWALFETLWAFAPADMLAALVLCHDIGICDLHLHQQLAILDKLALVEAPQRQAMWTTACTLLGSTSLAAEYPELLRTLAAMPCARWPFLITLCSPLLAQKWVCQAAQLKAVLRLAQACAQSERTPIAPLPQAPLPPLGNEPFAAYASTGDYDGENVMARNRIGASAAAIVRLQSLVRCHLPTVAVLKLIEVFIDNLEQAPQSAGGYLRQHRVIERQRLSRNPIRHPFSELQNAAYVLRHTGATAQTPQHSGLREGTRSIAQTPAHADAAISDAPLSERLAEGQFGADNQDIWANEPYRLNGDVSIGMGDLAALVWTAIDVYVDPAHSAVERARAQANMRLDFVSSLAACREDDARRVCQAGMAQRLLTCLQVEYGLDTPLFTPQDVLTACAREFSDSFASPELCTPQHVEAFYRRSVRHAQSLFAVAPQAQKSFFEHLEAYLRQEFDWAPASAALCASP